VQVHIDFSMLCARFGLARCTFRVFAHFRSENGPGETLQNLLIKANLAAVSEARKRAWLRAAKQAELALSKAIGATKMLRKGVSGHVQLNKLTQH
jgi:hypothetical protein